MSRDALLAALVNDIYQQVSEKQSLAALGPALSGVIGATVIPLVARPGAVGDNAAVRAILSALVSYAATEVKEATSATEAQKAVAVAVVAYLQCITPKDPKDDPVKLLAACDVGANVDQLVGEDILIPAAAHAMANELVAIATPTPTGGDIHPRMTHAINTVFQTSCMLLRNANPKGDDKDNTPQRFACDDPKAIANTQDPLALAQPIVVDAYNHETNGLVAAIVHALKVLADTGSAKVDVHD